MILLVDIGNTRIKWALFDGHKLLSVSAEVHRDWTPAIAQRHLIADIERPSRVLIANVAGGAIATVVSEAARAHWSIESEFVHSTSEAAGVHTGYRDPKQLGVDRWLAIVAAYNLEKRAVCIASVGTALTLDCVDANGQHFGGIIVPGPNLMTDSLYRDTGDIAKRAQSQPLAQRQNASSTPFADTTLAAVEQGVTYALAATIERAFTEFQARIGATPALVLSGGGASRTVEALRVPCRLIPDLVLRGLSELARAQAR